jgi:hypothetical protein
MADVGQDVKDSLTSPFRKAVDTVSGWMGGTQKPAQQKQESDYSKQDRASKVAAATASFAPQKTQDPKLGQTKKKVRARTAPGKASQKRSY